MSANLDEWWQWRHDKDAHDRAQDEELAELTTDVAVIKNTQKIQQDNQSARHSSSLQITLVIISAAVSSVLLVIQLLAARGGP